MPDVFEYINLSQLQKTKRDAIVQGILNAIAGNVLKKGDPLPSVNRMIMKLGTARMTVVAALNILKEKGVIVSVNRVGYFIRDVNIKRELKVLLFLSWLNSYHEILYNSIIESINSDDIVIDLFFHHCNPRTFSIILHENLGSYGLYVISGMEDKKIRSDLAHVPPKKLLQIIRPPVLEGMSYICQDFYAGLKDSLGKLSKHLKKYTTSILVFSNKMGHPESIKQAFHDYFTEIGMARQVEEKIRPELISKGTFFWVIDDSDLISLIKMAGKTGLCIGKEIGILSYNDTPMKEIIASGITVISVDFARLGKSIANFIMNPQPTAEVFMPEVIIRNSV